MTQTGTGPPVTEEGVALSHLRRSRDDKVIAGVCGGLAAYFGVDPLWFRLAFVVLAIGGGSGVLIYLISWLVIPEQGEGQTLVAREGASRSDGAVVVGVALVAVGLMVLFNNLIPWFDRIMWPMVVIAAGLALLYTGRRRDK